MRIAVVTAAVLGLAGLAGATTVPPALVSAIHGRVVGWAPSGSDWFAVYVAGRGKGWCRLSGATWRMALVPKASAPPRASADRRIGAAMCGNYLAWVRAGRFSDGRHREVAFMLWATPSLGATAYIYRVRGERFRGLASFNGDRVALSRGVVRVSYENRGRSPHGELVDV